MAEYIEREKTVELLRRLGNREYRKEKGTIQDAIKMISYPEYTPTADVAPVVHGRIVGSLEDGRYRRRFSCCGEDATMITQWAWPKYCPHCGAKMDGGADHEAD